MEYIVITVVFVGPFLLSSVFEMLPLVLRGHET
jgi:hypothetical protein